MEFRYPTASAEANMNAMKYLTQNLSAPEKGREEVESLIRVLGTSITSYPSWHPILTIPRGQGEERSDLGSLYEGIDHTIKFVRGFVTCPYSEEKANGLVDQVNALTGLSAYRTDTPLYSDHAYPVVVEATEVMLEADGTIRSRDALAWCVQELVRNAHHAQVAETWWSMRSYLLGEPHGSRSSLLVNQYTGGHMRKILEALNNSGMYGPVKEWSLDMLSKKKRELIGETLLRTALKKYEKGSEKFTFELNGERCKASVRDTWDDGYELSVNVMIGASELVVSGFYYPEQDLLQSSDPKGKQALAEKFL
ncbi:MULTISPECIES: hypothetical protein [Aeromonas]|uniref:Uncharacterized protein n=2 Tax=Aeromonadaceae TaxID=84642 RepID=A0A1I9S1Y0_AERSS|nr:MULTISPECIES: hypothetical protein [Aeromonas]AOZ60572.1 hypothetical protein [Aeromonas salmonicida subsp. salmonicida]MBS2783262.1 hypothetical protein [Aeromonas salmonicida]MDO2438303.1 hypothetical protein [Aeromonas veronii]TKY41852.1 hypothetical protein WH04_14195 [Aeromonas salmonicida subsp. salmonicida]